MTSAPPTAIMAAASSCAPSGSGSLPLASQDGRDLPFPPPHSPPHLGYHSIFPLSFFRTYLLSPKARPWQGTWGALWQHGFPHCNPAHCGCHMHEEEGATGFFCYGCWGRDGLVTLGEPKSLFCPYKPQLWLSGLRSPLVFWQHEGFWMCLTKEVGSPHRKASA